jgi:dihydrolipoamide dehydrogenase
MPDVDVLVLGAGPAGSTAALTAAAAGARVAVVEAERPGGACVHHACIPTNILLGAAEAYLTAREMDVLGVFSAGEAFQYARATARREPLVRLLADGLTAALRMRKVELIPGRAAFTAPDRVTLVGSRDAVSAEAFVIATGTRWQPPAVPGVHPERVLTPDQVQALLTPPASALVLGGGPADTAFALEYAFLLAVAGSRVTLATPHPRLIPALDADLAEVAAATLTDVGVAMLYEAAVVAGEGEQVRVRHRDGAITVPAEVVVAADPRRPTTEGLGLAAAGVRTGGAGVPVDRACRTNVPHIYAAGDVTGGAMLTAAALHMGEVAGRNAVGGEAVTRLSRLPHLFHTVPEIGWIGLSEERARAAGYQVRTGVCDLGFTARAVALGARRGLVKVVAEAELGEVLGVHVVGPGAAEILAAAATAMQAELPVQELAATVHWHPSMAEALAEAARRCGAE